MYIKKLFVITMLLVISFANTAFAKPQDVDVYLMRGLMGFMFKNTGGIYRMEKELKAKGYNVTLTCWQDGCRKGIVKSIKANPKRKFAIIGHSMGGNGVTLIGPELDKAGVRIPYAVVLDAPMPKPLTKNFKKVDNFYQFNDFRNPILVPLSSKIDLKQYNFRKKYDHFQVANAKEVTDRIYKQLEILSNM